MCLAHVSLLPGGKAVVLNFSNSAFDVMFVDVNSDPAIIEKGIEMALATLSCFPTDQQINEALEDFHDVVISMFALNEMGRLYRVTDVTS